MSRLDLLHSVWTHHSLTIDEYHERTPDKAVANGHYYSDKAPGTVALAFPGFAVSALALKVLGVGVESKTGWLATSWAACASSQALPAAVGAVLLWVWLTGFVGQRTAFITIVALWLGSMPLPYSTLLFSHAQVVGLIATAVWAIDLLGECRIDVPVESSCSGSPGGASGNPPFAGPTRGRLALAGFCLGLAVASEYTVGLIAVTLALYVVLRRRHGLWAFAVGATIPLLLIPAYSWATVGSPWTLPYSYQASFPQMKEGLYAIKWPDAVTASSLLFSPTRGLFFWSPFLVLAGFGYPVLFRRSSGGFWLMYALPLLQIAVISGRVWDWQAGFAFGARYLAPILPLLALPCALGVQRWPKAGMTLAAYSIGVTTLATLTDTCASYAIYSPLTELNIPKFLTGEFSHNFGMTVLGLPPYASVAAYCAILIGGGWWLWRHLPAEGPSDTATMGKMERNL